MALTKTLNDTGITYWVLESATVYLRQDKATLNYYGYADQTAFENNDMFILTRCIEVPLSEFSNSESELSAFAYDLLSDLIDNENA